MQIELVTFISPFILALFSGIVSIGIFIMKKVLERIQKLEDNDRDHVTMGEVRRVIEDQVDPMKQQVRRIEIKLDKIIEMMINK